MDVVPQRGYCRYQHDGSARVLSRTQWRSDFARFYVLRTYTANQRSEKKITLSKTTVTYRTACFPDILTLSDGTFPLGQPLEVRAHIDIPGLHLCLGRSTTQLIRCSLRRYGPGTRKCTQTYHGGTG